MDKILLFYVLFLSANSSVISQNWHTDFKSSKMEAQEKEYPILLLFSGSDWCAPCIKLKKEILDTETFQNYASDHFVLLKADFPRKKKNQLPQPLQDQNAQLAEQYNKSGGFPMVVLLDEKGTKLGELGYEKTSPKSYIEMLNALIK